MMTHLMSYLKPCTRLRVVFALVCFCSITVSVTAQKTEEKNIREQRKKSNDAIARHDTTAIGQYWLEDISVLTSRSTSLQGRAANLRAFQQEFQSKGQLMYIRTPSIIEIFSAWNMAAEYGAWTGTWISNGETIQVKGSYYAKWHFQNGNWKIKSEVYVPTACSGGEFCKLQPVLAPNTPTIVVQNYYYPKPGKELEVIATRKRASQVRAQLGLPVGRILQKTSDSATQPYIVWECEYPSLKAREEDVSRIDHSEEFKKVQDHMSTLLEKFDRGVWLILP